jgi:hypothetical protein
MRFSNGSTGEGGMTMYGNIILGDYKSGTGQTIPIAEIHPFMKPLINQLALEHPQWVFRRETHAYTTSDEGRVPVATSFDILEKREVLGTIRWETRYRQFKNESVFVIENPRIGKARRRAEVKTCDIKRAKAVVSKFVSPKSLVERFAEEQLGAALVLETVVTNKARAYAYSYEPILGMQAVYMKNNWESFRASLTSEQLVLMQRMDEATDERNASQSVKDAYKNGKALTVHIHGDNYLTGNTVGNGRMNLLLSEELPPHIKRAIGILKLVEPSQVVSQVGFKANDNTFIVFSDEPKT